MVVKPVFYGSLSYPMVLNFQGYKKSEILWNPQYQQEGYILFPLDRKYFIEIFEP